MRSLKDTLTLVIIFAFLYILVFLYNGGIDSIINKIDTIKNEKLRFPHIETLLAAEQFDAALNAIDSELATHNQKLLLSSQFAWLYHQKALILKDRYHYHDAIKAMQLAQQYEYKYGRNESIASWQSILEKNQVERNKSTIYRVARNTGLNKTLTQKVTIAYIYINDNVNKNWTRQQRLINAIRLNDVIAFLQREATRYQQPELDINIRSFVMKSPKGIGKNLLRKKNTFTFLMQHFLIQSPYKDVKDFITDMQRGEQGQVALVFHSNYDARSYAIQCVRNCYYEYAMLTKDVTKKHSINFLTSTQAHEILHLFGAGDLYQIKDAKNFAVTDIMNYYSKELRYGSISPITAWAIGWHDLPETPFKVEEY